MLIVAIRTFILYIVLLISMGIMGKSELSKMSPFQMVIVFMIAELAAIPIDSTSASLINGIMAIATLMFLQVLISFLSTKCEILKNLVSGKPSILIEKGKLNLKELKRLRITNTDLLEQLRIENTPSIDTVEYAILESNGELTVIPKANNKPITPKDLQISVSESALPMILVSDGTLYKKNLYYSGITEESFNKKLQSVGVNSYKEIFLAFFDENKEIHLYLFSEKSSPYALEVKL